MKIIDQKDPAKITLELSGEELELIYAVLADVQTGPHQIDDESWDAHIGLPRSLEDSIVESLGEILSNIHSGD